MEKVTRKIADSLRAVEKWVEDHDYMGYEPFDGLSSVLRPLTFDNLFMERLLQQLVRQSPINLRPLLGVRPQESTKGRGYMGWGYLTMLKVTGDGSYRDKAAACLGWLAENSSPYYDELSWGNHFDFSSRGGKLPKLEPIIVWTSLIGQACLDAYEQIGDEKYLNMSRSIMDWISALPREKTASGDCLSYVRYQQSSIHNSNMLGAAFLARGASVTGDGKMMEVARSAMEYSCTRQLEDGAWWYGDAPMYHWVDNFHTGYNLDSLKCYIESSGDETWRDNLVKGLAFFKDNFFEQDGLPKYYHNRAYPVDIQCASQAVTTLALFAEEDPECLELGVKVANWIIDNMQTRKGYFIYRIYPWGRATTPMLHWGQATMYKGLTLLYARLMEKREG